MTAQPNDTRAPMTHESPAPQFTWKPITENEPAQDQVVLTRIDDDLGSRNEVRLRRHGRLWFFPDMSMYVYYVPTHYLPEPSHA